MRAFVKVQDGCSFSCTFCVIPLVRGDIIDRTERVLAGRQFATIATTATATLTCSIQGTRAAR